MAPVRPFRDEIMAGSTRDVRWPERKKKRSRPKAAPLIYQSHEDAARDKIRRAAPSIPYFIATGYIGCGLSRR